MLEQTQVFLKQEGWRYDLTSPNELEKVLHGAALYASVTVIEELLEYPVDPNHRDGLGQTVLQAVCGYCSNSNREQQSHYAKVVTLLLKYGAGLHDGVVFPAKQDHIGKNALWLAVFSNAMPIVEGLLAAGAKDDCGALVKAVEHDSLDLITRLTSRAEFSF